MKAANINSTGDLVKFAENRLQWKPKGNQRLNEADEKSIYERLNAAKRDRSKKESGEESIDDRMDRFAQLQKASFQLLVSSPNGWQSFLSRNYKARRVEFVNGKWRPISTVRRFDET